MADIKVERKDGKYIVDFGDEGNTMLNERYERFVTEVKTKRNDLSDEDKEKILLSEEAQNCRLIADWMGRLLDLMIVEKKVEQEGVPEEEAMAEMNAKNAKIIVCDVQDNSTIENETTVPEEEVILVD